MHVLITTGIFPPDIGGPATYVPQIATGLAARGHAVTVLTLSDDLDHNDGAYPFQVLRLLRAQPKVLRILRTVHAIWRLGQRADVLFVNGIAMEAVLTNLVLGKGLVLKVVGDLAWERVTARGWSHETFEAFQSARHGPTVGLLKWMRAWWTRRADQVIVPSRYLVRWVVGWGVSEARITVVHNAVASTDGLTPLSSPLRTPVKLVTAGRLVPWKRVDRILDAIADMNDVGLVIIGDGIERKRLESRISELGLEDRVCIAGARGHRETVALMATCDVFVLNSTYEGLPHVVLEAMAVGLPVVATDTGGTAELVQHRCNGLLIPASGCGLGDALASLLADRTMRKNLSEGAQRTAQGLCLASTLDLTERVLLTANAR
jgi:glycosyltransferase involved in cell wall biosynthesis